LRDWWCIEGEHAPTCETGGGIEGEHMLLGGSQMLPGGRWMSAVEDTRGQSPVMRCAMKL